MTSVGVIGGGYAGLRVVRRLHAALGTRVRTTLFDRHNRHQLLTRLPEVVSGHLSADKAWIPFERLLPGSTEYVHEAVTSIDAQSRTVRLSSSIRHFDLLVIAAGSAPNPGVVPGVEQFALPLKTVPDAIRIYQRLVSAARSKERVRVVVAGSGYTAVEVAGELASPVVFSELGTLDVILIAPDGVLLPDGNVRLSRIAGRLLTERNVELRLQDRIIEILSGALKSHSSGTSACDVVIWAMRAVGPSSLLRSGPIRADGKIEVDPYLRCTAFPGVYVAGDAAFVYDYRRSRPVPASAQMALQEADIVANNIGAELGVGSLREFRTMPLGEALSLGNGEAVAEISGIVVTGRVAASAKKAALVRYLTGLGGRRLLQEFA